MYFVNNPI